VLLNSDSVNVDWDTTVGGGGFECVIVERMLNAVWYEDVVCTSRQVYQLRLP
jgi:hypothetical protein